MRLTHKTILITGGSRGIGLAMTQELMQRGNTAIIVGRDEARLQHLATQYPGLITKACDLTDAMQREALVQWLYETAPPIDVLVNNAGIQYNHDWQHGALPAQHIDTEIQLNLTAPMQLCRALLPLLQERDEAAIINVTSGLAVAPKQSAPVYCATKAALRSFTQTLRYQLEQTHIGVFELIPPVVDTDMTRGRGNNKITPKQCALACIDGVQRNKTEIPVHKARLLMWIWQFLPRIAQRILRHA